jgi:hypothetical protein
MLFAGRSFRRQLAAAFNKEVKNKDFERFLKAAASCRTPKAP